VTLEFHRYRDSDHAAVRRLFISINRELARPDLRDAFESYVAVSLRDEIDRLAKYYAERQGAFFVVHDGEKLAGVFGLERIGAQSAELRRMYVDAAYRRRGLARRMLDYAEQACREAGTRVLTLSTSELQQAALAFYRASGYRLVSEETGAAQSNKTVGNIRRYHFEKDLGLTVAQKRHPS
jgi:GNAT superfamily N-acetyltransferase